MPVIELNGHLAEGEQLMAAGKYVITEFNEMDGDATNFIIEGLNTQKKKVFVEDGKLIVEIVGLRDAANVTWTGANGNASGLAMMLELARKLSYSRSLVRRSVLFVAFGASARLSRLRYCR